MKMLRLFNESDGINEIIKSKGIEVICNLLEWDYEQYPKCYFQIIWSNLPSMDNILRIFEVIDYFKPALWVIMTSKKMSKQLGFIKHPFYQYEVQNKEKIKLLTNIHEWKPKKAYNTKELVEDILNAVGIVCFK